MKTFPTPSPPSNLHNLPKSSLKHLQTHITSQFKSLYTFQSDYYNINIINQIICNDCAHIVAVFKDYLIYGDHSEFLQGMYTIDDSNDILPKIYEYYESCSVIFPNYIALPESKYIYKNIQRKQRVIDNQQELELEEERKKNMKIQNNNNNNSGSSSSNTLNKVFNTQAVDSILNQTNTSNIRMIMGLPALFGGCGGNNGSCNNNSNNNNKVSEEMSLCYNNNNKEDDEMIKQFEKVVDMIEQSEFWSEVNKRKIVNCALRKKQSKNILTNTHTHMNGNVNINNNNNNNINNNHNTCLHNCNSNNSKSKRKQSKSKAHTNNTSKTNNNNTTTTNHSHVIRGRNYNRVNSINISSIIKMNSTSERDLKLSTNRTMRNFSKGASIIHNNTKKENKTINATSSLTTRHKHHKSQVVKKGIVNLLLSVNFDLIKRTFEEIAKKNTHQCNANNEQYHSSVNNKTHRHVRSSSHSRNPFTSTIVKLSDKILGISSVNVNNRMRRSGKYKSKEKEEHQHHQQRCVCVHVNSNQDNGNVALTSRESLKHVTNMNHHHHPVEIVTPVDMIKAKHNCKNSSINVSHKRTVASSTSIGGTATGSLGPQSNDDIYINNNNTKDCVVTNINKHINKNKPLSHRNKRNNNNNNINGCCCPLNNNHFSKTSVVHFNFKKPPLSNNTNTNANKVLQTSSHFKSLSFHNKQHSNNSTTTHKSKKKLTTPNNVVIPIRKDLNIKGIHIKGFDELLLKHNNSSSRNNNCCNGGIPSSERSSENNSNLKLNNNYALKSKTSRQRQRSRFNYLQGHSTYNINNNNIFKTTKH